MKVTVIIGLVLVLLTFLLNIFGLMNLIPLYITAPLLFCSLLYTCFHLNTRKQFKGF
ncbi:hypothetical protein PY093_14730 [Cytobacillus sp. S13-E01]|uniref:hypothetical protein n=1 Tax=Cytobacillus sp. S13-E01 TaxID=3031326 RepID=UPI0023D88C56|nr:hypothetical protein [Cytobacillus sp. S13-E01]MDF0727930.1 hypothetical protein [Cytobacillus sp. S13-E01]